MEVLVAGKSSVTGRGCLHLNAKQSNKGTVGPDEIQGLVEGRVMDGSQTPTTAFLLHQQDSFNTKYKSSMTYLSEIGCYVILV